MEGRDSEGQTSGLCTQKSAGATQLRPWEPDPNGRDLRGEIRVHSPPQAAENCNLLRDLLPKILDLTKVEKYQKSGFWYFKPGSCGY